MKARRRIRILMPVLWPRNIIPYDERKLRALGTVERVALYIATLDGALAEGDLSKEEQAITHDLVAAGLLQRADGVLVPVNRHSRDPETDVAGHLEHKRAKLGFAAAVVADAQRELDDRGPRAHAAIGIVTFPDTLEVVAQANAILAEAEDQLRALAEDAAPDHGKRARVMLFVGSAPS